MGVTQATLAASATPATDMMTAIEVVLTAAGWTYIHEMAAATAGTVGAVRVWADPNTTVASNVYTGCVLYIEYYDTAGAWTGGAAGPGLRFRMSEKYDSAAAGSPASRVKWAVPGCTGAITPTANNAIDDTYVALYQAAGASQKVGFIEIPVGASGFDYWVGANDTTFFYMNNVGGYQSSLKNGHFFVGGHWSWQGDKNTTVAALALYMMARNVGTDDDCSWAGSTSAAYPVRTSREPGCTVAATTAFAWRPGSRFMLNGALGADWGFTSAANHNAYSTRYVAQAYVHGAASNTWRLDAYASATLPGIYVIDNWTGSHFVGAILGERLTAGGLTLITLGSPQNGVTNTNTQPALFIDDGLF
jgi:hypothetical protein